MNVHIYDECGLPKLTSVCKSSMQTLKKNPYTPNHHVCLNVTTPTSGPLLLKHHDQPSRDHKVITTTKTKREENTLNALFTWTYLMT